MRGRSCSAVGAQRLRTAAAILSLRSVRGKPKERKSRRPGGQSISAKNAKIIQPKRIIPRGESPIWTRVDGNCIPIAGPMHGSFPGDVRRSNGYRSSRTEISIHVRRSGCGTPKVSFWSLGESLRLADMTRRTAASLRSDRCETARGSDAGLGMLPIASLETEKIPSRFTLCLHVTIVPCNGCYMWHMGETDHDRSTKDRVNSA
jgi:hypothetical protein